MNYKEKEKERAELSKIIGEVKRLKARANEIRSKLKEDKVKTAHQRGDYH